MASTEPLVIREVNQHRARSQWALVVLAALIMGAGRRYLPLPAGRLPSEESQEAGDCSAGTTHTKQRGAQH